MIITTYTNKQKKNKLLVFTLNNIVIKTNDIYIKI